MNELILSTHQVVSCDTVESIKVTFGIDFPSVQLNDQEQRAIISNYDNGFYDIASEIVWRRTISVLRDRLAVFGEDFIGDMLGYDRPVSIDRISEQEVIDLNCDVGFIKQNERMELLHHSEQILRYTSRDYQMLEKVNISKQQASALISDCLSFVLSDMTGPTMLHFNDIRKMLRTELLDKNNTFISNLEISEYFEKRTILRSLLNLARTDKEEEKQCVFHNMRIIIPIIWSGLAEKDRFSFGTTYAEIVNSDRKDYINTVKSILVNVHGFDYVPENLKSNSFIGAAKALLSVHYSLNNFYNEPSAARILSEMGSMIPDPAITDCINAVLICYTGNGYGVSREATPYFDAILSRMTLQKWELYMRDLSKNLDLLTQIASVKDATDNFVSIMKNFQLQSINITDDWTQKLIGRILENNYNSVKNMAHNQVVKLLTTRIFT